MLISEKIQQYLTPLIGAHTARVAVRTFCEKIGKKPETLTPQDIPQLASSMEGMLKTLCGAEKAQTAVKEMSAL